MPGDRSFRLIVGLARGLFVPTAYVTFFPNSCGELYRTLERGFPFTFFLHL